MWGKRARARAGLLAAVAATALVASFVAAVVLGVALRSAAPAVHATLAAGPVTATGVRVEAPLSDDAAAQDRAVRSGVRSLLRGVQVRLTRTVETSPIPVGVPGSHDRTAAIIVAASTPDLGRAVHVVDGSWPTATQPARVALQTQAAKALGVGVGDRITLPTADGDTALTVAATWRPADPSAGVWFGDAEPGTGRAVVTAATLGDVNASPTARWTVVPDAATTPVQLATLEHGFAAMTKRLSADDAVTAGGLAVTGDGEQTATAMRRSLASVGVIVPLPLTMTAVGAVLSLVLLALLLRGSRAAETTLLRARGAGRRRLIVTALAESVVAGIAGSVVGAVAAATALAVTGPGLSASLPLPVVFVIPATAVALAVIAVQTGAVAFEVSAPLAAVAPRRARMRSVTSAGLTVLVVLAAAFATWRFVGLGDSRDLSALAAPALALLATSLLALLVFEPAARWADRLGSAARRVGVMLAAKQLGRGIAFVTAPVALVVLAVAGSILGASLHGTWQRFGDDAAHATGAADLRVRTDPDPATGLQPTTRYAGITGVTAALPALEVDARAGSSDLGVVAAPTGSLGAIAAGNSAAYGLPGLRTALAGAPDRSGADASDRGEPVLPDGARAMSLTMTLGPADVTVTPTVWLATVDGQLTRLAFPRLSAGAGGAAAGAKATTTITTRPAALPNGVSWRDGRVVAIDLTAHGTAGAAVSARVDTMTVSSSRGAKTLRAPGNWGVVTEPFDTTPAVHADGTGIAGILADGETTARLMPPSPGPLRIAPTRAFAVGNGLRRGDTPTIDGLSWTLPARIAATVDVVPGRPTDAAAIVDLGDLQRALLRQLSDPPGADQVWLAAPDPQTAFAAVTAAAPEGATVTLASSSFAERFVGPAFVGVAIGCAGCIGFAAIALAGAAAALARRRRPEVAVLRALGFTTRQQVTGRRGELAVTVAVAAALGILAGAVVSLVIAPTVARLTIATAPPGLPLSVTADPVALGLGLAATTAAAAAIVLGYGRAVRAQAASGDYREDAP